MNPPAPDAARQNQLRVLRALDEAAAKLESLERARHEPIAVVGLACRLPGGVRDAAAFWRLLQAGGDATGEVPADRWDVDAFHDPDPDEPGKICTRRGAFLDEVDRFDAAYFGLSPREAAAMDPQQRLLLEVAHEALDSAGRLGDRHDENATGVFVGLTNNDYGQLLKAAAGDRPLDAYYVTGNAPNAAAGRISYLLGLRGPSLTVDSACSSSLVTVHLACQSLRAGECALALAGGANLILAPETSAALSRARMLAPDGRCKTFDAAADGYARGEGCGLVVLKRLGDAQRDGDCVLAVIRGSAVNQDGPSSGFTVPSGAAQRRLLRAALAAAKLAPADIDYVEAHGTGTALGDPIEVGALAEVFGAQRPADRPLLLGSVKTNLGHLESAAGVAGLIKTVLALWHRELPAHLHFRTPSPHIPWRELPVAVVAAARAWPEANRPRRAGVSSFGVSGTNAHLILEEAPDAGAPRALPLPKRRFRGERHWAPPPPAESSGRDWLYHVAWRERARRERAVSPVAFAPAANVARELRAWLENAENQPGPRAYGDCLAVLEKAAAGYARQAVQALGAAAVREVAAPHRALFSRLQSLAAGPGGGEDPAALLAQLRATVPEAAAETTLLARCGGQLVDVLRGRVDPLTLLFPPNEPVTAASLYRDTPAARAANALVHAALAAALPAGRPLRVLEIGAGTGGTTAAVLPALPAEGAEYVFTDVSPLFVTQARERYRDRPWIRPQLLDIERDPLAQGFAPGEFDVIVAANVLHATRDLGATLRHVRRLLAGGGVLVLLEATAPLGFLDLIFGLTEGWWRFADTELRPAHALLPAARWGEALHATGFADAEAFSHPESAGAIFAPQSVVLARASGPTAARPETADGAWLIAAEEGAKFVDALAAKLTAAGGTCERVRPGEDLAARLAARTDWRGAVHAAALGAGDPLAVPPLESALRLTQALAARPLPLFFLTRDALAAQAGDAVDGLGGAALWGFARTVAQEHPELRPVCLDLDGAVEAAAIAAELLAPDGETQIAWRGETRRVARLARGDDGTTQGRMAIRADATYLVVGGLGGLGLPLARWLVEHGARHVVLAGRSAPTPIVRATLDDLAADGAEVRVVAMDVAREADVAHVLREIAATPWPLRGLVHAAGVLDDGVVPQLTWEKFARVCGPKIAGSWHLHRLTRELSLDWLVLFSSATSLLGSPGQANHAAANAFQDALAHHRRARGLPTLSINWGPWSEIGAAAQRDFGARVKTKGIGTIAPAKGWRAWAQLGEKLPTQVAVVPVNWPEVPANLTAAPFFSEVRTAAPAIAAEAATPVEAWVKLPRPERTARLLAEVRTEVARVLGLDGPGRVDPAQGFFALGLDSLTSVELRNRLQARVGRALPSTLAFDAPTAEKLAAFLAGLWEETSSAAASGLTAVPAAEANRASAAPAGADAAIAIVGLALRFPGADTPEKLWELLRGGVDAIAEVPRERWDIEAFYDADPAAPGKMITRHGGFIAGADQFDAAFFGVSPREAEHMDPQHRILLETSWEALERAGLAADALAGTPTGVFVGISNQDYTQLLAARGLDAIDPYVGSGNAHSVAAGRLSYTLGLQGPSLAIDTACSSSLVAVHLAAQSLRAGECELALAGGVNLLLSPLITVNHSRARMLAPDGRCKTFDAAADGFIRSDGCGVVVLKKLSAAERDGDRILAVLRGSAVNQDGRTSGLTVPSGPAQQAVIRAALRQAGVAPAEVGYVEAHGTGTALGDPIELGALQAVFGPGRAQNDPLRVGSIKTNLGHLESAAGVAGLIKAVLALQRREIPPHLHFRTPNPLVPWAELALEIPTRPTPWTARVAGVSSFGFGGTNAHLVLGAAPAPTTPDAGAADVPPLPLVLSARTEPALRELAVRYADFLGRTTEPWAEIAQAAATGRSAFKHRAVVGSENAAAARTQLEKLARGEAPSDVATAVVGEKPKVAFLFSGQGSLYAGAGRELYRANAVYRAALDECRAIVTRRAGWDVVAALDSEEKLARTEFSQVALFALEYALARTWQAWGVQPALVLGHSVGEYAAACLAGVLTTEAALGLLIERARLMGGLPEDGAMLAVSASEAEVAEVLARHRLEPGAINSPRQIVLTGEKTAIAAAAAELKTRGIRTQALAVRQAYHSRHMEPMLGTFGRAAGATKFGAASTAEFISSVSGRVVGAELATAEYWTAQVRQPVRFGAAVEAAQRAGAELIIEVGPRGILLALAQQSWTAGEGEWLTSLRPGTSEMAQLRESAARAWLRGAPVAWRKVCADDSRRRVELPTYPFQRRRYWFEERPASATVPVGAPAPAPAYVIDWEAQRNRETGEGRRGTGQTSGQPAGTWCVVGASEPIVAELRRLGEPIVSDLAAANRGVMVCARGSAEDLPLLQEVVCRLRAPARLWVVVAQHEPEAALVWAAAKVAALEYPELHVTRIDASADVTPSALVAELLAHSPEDDVRLRAGGRDVARLHPHALPTENFRPKPDGTYLVTGGLGALGRRVAGWLVERGARHLLLLGRKAPSAQAEADLQRWRAQGVAVAVRAADVADRTALADVLRGCAPALRGVFHAAGVAGYEPLAALTPDAWRAVLRPKVDGARWLDELTATQPLDAFVLFSSIASVWGSKGQAHYAAANGWLDALAARRRAEGRVALSVSWGPWAGGGMATPEAAALLASSGVRLMDPAAALAALERALVGERAQVAVADVDWPRFRQVYELRGPRSLLARLPVPASEPSAEPVTGRSAIPATLPALRAHVQQTLAQILKLPAGELPDPRQGFADLGVDSLMAVDLKNRLARDLGMALPATLAFDYPDAERLARHLLARLAPAEKPSVAVAAEPTLGAAGIGELSEAEVEALLLKKLERL
jgi:acyl transferase domain-containing protein/NAD(P)-dependent dehydrogenase (short-subunit alcohol dehydrogenase family)/SAM-dependent methyltransferase/acyl carrier protein